MIIKIFATLERVSDDKPYNTKIDEAPMGLGRGGEGQDARVGDDV